MSTVAAPNPPSVQDTLRKMVDLLHRIPPEQRASFAREQLLRSAPAIVQLFDNLDRTQLDRTALYLVLQPHSRETRLARAAQLAGWNIVIVHGRELAKKFGDDFPLRAAAKHIFEFVFAAWLFPGALVHSFSLSGDQAHLIARLKPRRLVVDLYDTCSGMTYMTKSQHNAEQEVLGLADGIVHRDLRIHYLQKLHGYPRAPHNIFLYDPLPDTNPAVAGPRRDPDEPIRVGSTGWLGKPADSIFRVAAALCRTGVHVHVHLNGFESLVSETVDKCRRFAVEHPTFHLEPTLSGGAYWQALARYDFGLSINERLMFDEPLVDLTPDYLAGCGSSRLADYVCAGLGVICTPELRFQSFWARRYSPALVSATRDWLQNPLPALVAALPRVRQGQPPSLAAITERGVSSRLGRFYSEIAAS